MPLSTYWSEKGVNLLLYFLWDFDVFGNNCHVRGTIFLGVDYTILGNQRMLKQQQ